MDVAPWLESWLIVAKNKEKFNNLLIKSNINININTNLSKCLNKSNNLDMNSLNIIMKSLNLKDNYGNSSSDKVYASEDSSDDEEDDTYFIHKAFNLALTNSDANINTNFLKTNYLLLNRKLNMHDLASSEIPSEILDIEQRNNSFGEETPREIERLLPKAPLYRKDQSYYIEAFRTMIHLEEAAQSQFISQFNTKNIRLRYTRSPREFHIKNDKFVSKMAEAVEESIVDSFTLKPVFTDTEKDNPRIKTNISIYGQIKGINKDNIFIEINDERYAEYVKSNCSRRSFDIYFQLNLTTFQLQHNALKWIKDHNLFDILVNNRQFHEDQDSIACLKNQLQYLELYSSFNGFSGVLGRKLNSEQRKAVFSIVNAENKPLPYLLFGPAGTGKTSTLVAAIEEIIRSTKNYVLVCANSNSACDEITERLIKVLKFGEMFRMYAITYDARKISETIKPISNWANHEFQFPSLKFLYQFRVVVCTLSTAGSITRGFHNPEFDRAHFSHIIIDECASTHETVTMIPIAGLCTSKGDVKSSIVLAGDPKQLDAVTKSGYAAKLGFSTSFMEQLFEEPLYKCHPRLGYNPAYITQLVKNYRSHPSILSIPNKLFYDNKLKAKAPEDLTNWFIGSEILPSKNFPIIFQHVVGTCKRSNRDFSLFNSKEAETVTHYIKRLLTEDDISKVKLTQSDIGVVTPYKLQCKVIGQSCRKNGFADITIGTAEVFQGQEKPVMIVSTVRTGGRLGFVKDPRRMNVIITRAKSLLIIVGDYQTLVEDSNWRELILYCHIVIGRSHFSGFELKTLDKG